MTTAVSYAYRYPFESARLDVQAKPAIHIATSLDRPAYDLFFDGRLRYPGVVGNALSILSSIFRTRFYEKLSLLMLDPVVTSSGGMLRFGFSAIIVPTGPIWVEGIFEGRAHPESLGQILGEFS
jgi:hypothetical protein